MDYFFIPLAKFFQWSFGILEALANTPNTIFIIGGFVGLFYWLWLQGKYNKEAANNPNQLK
ncbi:MAG TPA: hypothetical protein VK177_16575 [Flavobacteriales bacterium]|nr:hypothetical protein [Flavobacteriales bacterium]